jgi:hypothetical protein
MKELRFKFKDGIWRVAYAFDPNRQAIILIVGNKSGLSKQRFYKPFIKEANHRFDAHLQDLKKE